MITNARFVSIYVRDQERALDFWTNKLGFELLLDAPYEDVKSKGVEFSVPPSDAPWSPGGRWAKFSDPDGNLYGITQRA